MSKEKLGWRGWGWVLAWVDVFLLGLVLVYIIDFQVFLSFLLCFFAWFAFAKLLQGCAETLQRRIFLVKS